jgi:hypothetical protein
MKPKNAQRRLRNEHFPCVIDSTFSPMEREIVMAPTHDPVVVHLTSNY